MKILRLEVGGSWVKVGDEDEDNLPEGADPPTLVDLAKRNGITRPLRSANNALSNIMVSLPLILLGRSDYYTSHRIHRQWLWDNPHRKKEAEVAPESANSVRLSACVTIAEGGMVLQEDLELLAYPPAWDEVDELKDMVPATYMESKQHFDEMSKARSCASSCMASIGQPSA